MRNLSTLAGLWLRQERYADAETTLAEAVKRARSVHGDAHAETARLLEQHAEALRGSGRGAEAEQSESEARRIRVQLDGSS